MIERVEAHAAQGIFRIGHKLEKFTGKRVKVGIDDHDGSFLYELRLVKRDRLRGSIETRILIATAFGMGDDSF